MIQYNHHAALVHTLSNLPEKETRKRTRINSKNTASSRKHYYLLAYLLFFLRTSRQKQKNRGKELEKLLPLYLVYVSHQGRFGQPRTNWRRGRLQKAATTRDRCVVHMCASSVLSRRATSPAPVQRENCCYFLNLIQMGPRQNKSRISEIPRPRWYRTNIK